ncbi:DUF5776 domain-containing protein [Lentilactobacillus diolivorans]|uniref:galactosylceramidase n=2 Tax=Lentilactobacillus diolivorans TaxID=179838 RepID=A0A0R1SJ74_9LACO|nr:DUF5776 domain-containing protein [Lentilactobacillus diolivorans]KRL69231.1 hypothetical protein FC85_GL001590 [Lentilactobacillus diolivorans DSM 14421]GEP23920.1 hypothetical protein LDI01_15130 [Lentilactobacillus diolivorans]
MRKSKLWVSAVLSTATLIGITAFGVTQAQADTARNVTIDGSTVDTNQANTYKGFGMVSANGTSRLLLDYKAENPAKYWEIMNRLFNPNTGILDMIKVEMGADANTSTASTPATMRSVDEPANTLRGWDWHIVADAKKINPNLKVDMLRWSEPKWVSDAEKQGVEAGYAARYKWYKETIDSAYKTYGIKMDYVSADKNETRNVEPEWIKYLSGHLKKETSPYPMNGIKIVASDQIGGTDLPGKMLKDKALMDAIDVVSMHYQVHGDADIREVNKQGKQIWYSEALAPTTFAEYRLNSNTPKNGLGGTHGAIDVANSFINMYQSTTSLNNQSENSSGYMTRYEFQPAVSSFYDGSQYSTKELIDAQTPWSGNYYVDAGVPVTQQFTNFIKPGWEYIKSASEGDGQGANGLTNTTDNHLTLTDSSKKDYSVVITNDSDSPRGYNFTLKNMKDPSAILHAWKTTGPKSGEKYDANWLKNVGNVTPAKANNGTYTFNYTVDPNSVVTLSTTTGQSNYQPNDNQKQWKDDQLSLPYADNFDYTDSKYQNYRDTSVIDSANQGYLSSRDGTPRYFDDMGGAFQVVKSDDSGHNNVLQGMITAATFVGGWNPEPGNDTVMGDNRWANYQVSSDFKLDTKTPVTNSDPDFASLLARNLKSGGNNDSGYALKVDKSGQISLNKDGKSLKTITIPSFKADQWHNFALKVVGNTITGYLDNKEIVTYTDNDSPYSTGKIGLSSGYYHTQFDNLKIDPIDGQAQNVQRIDDLDSAINYSGDWTHAVPGSGDSNGAEGNVYNRSASSSNSGAFTFTMNGNEFNLIGKNNSAHLQITVDGQVIKDDAIANNSIDRGTAYSLANLSNGKHTVRVAVKSGNFLLDAIDEAQSPASSTTAGGTSTPNPPTTEISSSSNSSESSVTSSSTSNFSSSATSSSSSSTNGSTLVTKPGQLKVGEAVYAVKKVYLYKDANFKTNNRITVYSKQRRVNRPMFVVQGFARSSNGTLRYQVKDVNHYRKTNGKRGYITANRKYIVPAYYATMPKSKVNTIIAKKGVNAYRTVSLKGKAKHYKQGTKLKVEAIKKYHLTSRYRLVNGYYITGNKKLVMQKNY